MSRVRSRKRAESWLLVGEPVSGVLARDRDLDADALVQSLQLADLRAGREPVESRVVREVEARRAAMAQVTARVGRVGTEKEARNG